MSSYGRSSNEGHSYTTPYNSHFAQAALMETSMSQQSFASNNSHYSDNTFSTMSYGSTPPTPGMNYYQAQFMSPLDLHSPMSDYPDSMFRNETLASRRLAELVLYRDSDYQTTPGFMPQGMDYMGGALEGGPFELYPPNMFDADLEMLDFPEDDKHFSTAQASAAGSRRASQEGGRGGRSRKAPKSEKSFPCIHPGCMAMDQGARFTRPTDLRRHIMTVHNPELFDCEYGKGWCGRTGKNGFKRKDHYTEHVRDIHMKDIPKTARRKLEAAGSEKGNGGATSGRR